MDGKKKKLLIVFGILVLLLAVFLFLDPLENRSSESGTDAEKKQTNTAATQPTYEEGLTEYEQKAMEEDLASKEAWCWSGTENGQEIYEELWLFWRHTNDYTYSRWVGDKEERMISGHFWREDNELVYWMDGNQIEGEYRNGNLYIDGKEFTPLSDE